jgi:hypothetical protein
MGQALIALAAAVGNKEARKVKVAHVLDPSDNSDLPPPGPDQLEFWFSNYKQVKGGEPLVDREPTGDQIAAMHSRVVVHKMEPYGDFSLLTPHGKRFAKEMKFSSWVPMEDGTWQHVLLPGPANFSIWTSCWRVYECILIMLRDVDAQGCTQMVATPNALECYYEAFALLCRENPEAWHLCVVAEDRCRSEHFPRTWRKLAAKFGHAPTWSQVFEDAAADDKFWDREVRRPAISDLLRTKGNRNLSAEEDVAANVSMAVAEMKGAGKGRPRAKSQGGKNAFAKAQQAKQPQARMPFADDGAHPRKDHAGRYITSKDGRQLCFNYNKGSCKEPCQLKRAHFCQKCLEKHPAKNCTPDNKKRT